MLEHRKKERRKTENAGSEISVCSSSAKESANLFLKYSAMEPFPTHEINGVRGNRWPYLEQLDTRSLSPVVNHFVIDSDEEHSSTGTLGKYSNCAGKESNTHRINCMEFNPETIRKTCIVNKKHHRRRLLPEKGTEERRNILKMDARKRTQESSGKYSCPYCDYCAPFPSKVKRHVNNKHSDSHLCSDCNKRFDTFSLLRKHRSIEHPKLHRCEFCDFSHKVLADVRKHTVLNHENGVMCTVAGCNMRISRWRLKAHLDKDHSYSRTADASVVESAQTFSEAKCASLLQCSYCSFSSIDLEDYNLHMMNAHETGIECPFPECTVRFLLADMDDHFALMHEQTKQKGDKSGCHFQRYCRDSCTTATVSECASTSHCSDTISPESDELIPRKSVEVLRGTDQSFHCNLCDKNYRDFYLLRKHVKSVHEKCYAKHVRQMKYVCDWQNCGKAFTTSGLLQDHINCHQGIKPYHCSNCGCSFSARARFAVHLSKYHRMSIRDYNCVSELLGSSGTTKSRS